MITPSFALTATERVLPRMALDFTTAVLDPRITFTRTGDTATVTNSSGVIAAINADLPRFDYNPTTLACKGLLIEETRTNLLLNSLIDGTNLSTQLVTTTAVSQTLSFYGTGQIVLTGTSSATVVGTGAYPARQTLTFTPTVGVLTLTVTGTVQYAQLEVGAFATSFIPTDGTTKTRNADLATMTGTNFSDWFNASEGTFVCKASIPLTTSGNRGPWRVDDGSDANIIMSRNASGNLDFRVINAGSLIVALPNAITANVVFQQAAAYKTDNYAAALNGAGLATDTAGTVPTVNTMRIGNSTSTTAQLGCTIERIYYYPQRLTDNEVTAFSKQ